MARSSCDDYVHHEVNFSNTRSFGTILKSDLKETFFPDDPFRNTSNKKETHYVRAKRGLQYFIPILEWLPKYNVRMFLSDLLAGMTITSLAIPQGISYAKLGGMDPIVGLYSSFVPPLVYAVFGSSKHLAVGNVASASALLGNTISTVVSEKDDAQLHLYLIFTATFVAGVMQALLGIFRLGILVDFLSHATIVGFMSGTALIISLQQLKGLFGLKKFTKDTDVVSVLKSVFTQTHEWKWESVLLGVIFLVFLLSTKYLKKKNPKLFWVYAIAPLVTVIVGCLLSYFAHIDKHGIDVVGKLNNGLNPISIKDLNFNSKYLPAVVKAAGITGILAIAEGIAIARSFAMLKMDQIDGNKEMLAFGLMNIVGSFTSCYLTTGPFSKTAVNYNAGSKTAMSNIIMAFFMMLTLLFFAPVFSHTPLTALSAIIIVAMSGLVEYEEAYRLFKVDKFDFCIAMGGFLGVSFISMDVGLMISVGLSILRALLYVARPIVSNVKCLPNSKLYRDAQQYPSASGVSGTTILKIGSPLYFANSSYVREKISRWIENGTSMTKEKGNNVDHIILDLGGVTSIDMSGIEMLYEIRRSSEKKGIKILLSNPRMEVVEKLMLSKFIDIIGKESVFISVDKAVEACRVTNSESHKKSESMNISDSIEDDAYIDDDKLSRCSSIGRQ